jgi:hypothetical protein
MKTGSRLVALVLAGSLLAACTTVREPYRHGVEATATDTGVAYLWGGNDVEGEIYFTHVDGKHMPSRHLTGYPQSLVLAPGAHQVSVLLTKPGKSIEIDRDIAMEAGHTYVLRYRDTAAGTRAVISVEDLGAQRCRLELVGSKVADRTRLVCE